LEKSGDGDWRIAFSPSGQFAVAGHAVAGFQIYRTTDGRLIGPSFGMRDANVDANGELLTFSSDEQLLLTGSPQDASRLWRAPSPLQGAEVGFNQPHSIWSPSADRPVLATPDGAYIVIGDPQGHVHVVPSGTGLPEVEAKAGDVNFIGHASAIVRMAVDNGAKRVASAARDNSVRVWNVTGGDPLPWSTIIDADPVDAMQFSADGDLLAVRAGAAITMINVADGAKLAVLNIGETVGDISFAADGLLYVGTREGTLHLAQRAADDSWQVQQIWRGESGIRSLSVSPRGDFLVLVDTDNLASQFIIADGRVADAHLQLPSDLHEVAFDAVGSRVYFRTARWVHRATAAVTGLHWNDAVLAPRALPGASLVFRQDDATGGQRPLLPAARNGYVDLVDVSGDGAAALFGSRDELLEEWLGRVSASHPAVSEPVVQD
ncbi:MAG: WD40 repeat domain-containing protein, partial [Pseudomonadota bacterium]